MELGGIEGKAISLIDPATGIPDWTSVTAVRLLLKNGADPKIKNDDGLRPIDLTKNKQVRALLEK